MKGAVALSVAIMYVLATPMSSASTSRTNAAATQRGAKSDGEIHDQVLIRLAADADVKGGGINVNVKDGVVTLTGRVPTEKIKSRAGRLAKRVRGVKAVDNRLAVGGRL